LLATWLPFLAIMSSTSPLALAQHLAFRHDTTRPIRPFDEDRTSDALRNTHTRQRGGVAASILLRMHAQVPRRNHQFGPLVSADPSTRCRSASVTGLAPSPQRPWGCEKSSNAVRNLRARGLWCASAFRKRWQTYIKQKSLEKNKGDRSLPHRACDLRDARSPASVSKT
jgi:hypothetical protein